MDNKVEETKLNKVAEKTTNKALKKSIAEKIDKVNDNKDVLK